MSAAMTEPYVTTREFDNAISGLREDVSEVSQKIDKLLAQKTGEARVMGNIEATLKGFQIRFERLEFDSKEHKALIDDLWERRDKDIRSGLKWWGQFMLVGASAVCTYIVTRLTK